MLATARNLLCHLQHRPQADTPLPSNHLLFLLNLRRCRIAGREARRVSRRALPRSIPRGPTAYVIRPQSSSRLPRDSSKMDSASPNDPESSFVMFSHKYRTNRHLHQEKRRRSSGSFRRNACFGRLRLPAASLLVAAALCRRAASKLSGKRSACRCIGLILRSHTTDYTTIGIRFPEENWGASTI